ncbi:hypothetical protein BDW75DRAFT_233164 [Aspergillus navahoensis]
MDGTEEYDLVHPLGTIEKELPASKCLGEVEPHAPVHVTTESATVKQGKHTSIPPLSRIINLNDFESAARQCLSERAWVYYSSGAESSSSLERNLADWNKVTFRPRVLRNVEQVNTNRTILAHLSSLPIFIAPCALGRLGHKDGELCLVRGAAQFNIPYVTSMGASVAYEELAGCLKEENHGGYLFFQLYVNKERHTIRQTIQRARSLGFRALVVTVDTPTIDSAANRRMPYLASLSWDDLAWIAHEWQNAGPLCLKGLTTVEDVQLAVQAGYTSIYLSNHGGRQLDGAPSGLHVLMEIRRYCPDLLRQCEILVDGGVRRGSDVLKALALGALGVGIGRPFMYAMGTHGTEGVCRALEILSDEIQINMRLLGATSLQEVGARIVNTRQLERDIVVDLEPGARQGVPKACM